MRENKDDRRVRKTKKAFRQGLITLLSQKSINEITVKELTDLVDVHRGTFYFHYQDIYDLKNKIVDEMIGEIKELFENFPPVQSIDDSLPILTSINSYLSENAEICRMLLGGNSNSVFNGRLKMIIRDMCMDRWLQRLSEGTEKDDLEYFVEYLLSGLLAVMSLWLERGTPCPPEVLAVKIRDMCLMGVGYIVKRGVYENVTKESH